MQILLVLLAFETLSKFVQVVKAFMRVLEILKSTFEINMLDKVFKARFIILFIDIFHHFITSFYQIPMTT